jgi:AhpD family alkylhydroperoxidase
VRASQINGCAYCIDMHTKDARVRGESEQRLYALSAWGETPFFSEREWAALAWMEAVTAISDTLRPTRCTSRHEAGSPKRSWWISRWLSWRSTGGTA